MEQLVDKVTAIRACAKRLCLSCLMTNVTEVLMLAPKESPSYDDLLLTVLEAEVKSREEKQLLHWVEEGYNLMLAGPCRTL